MSLTIRIDAMESPAREVFREAYDLFAEALVIPNEWLPARLRNRKAGGATPAAIFRDQRSRMERKQQRESAHATLKAEKESRLGEYQKSCDHPDGIEYDISNEALIQQAEKAFARMLNIRPD